MNNKSLYPLKFHPQLKEKVWGGNKLSTLLGKKGTGAIGESWEISGVENNVSSVSNGRLNGKLLTALIEDYTIDLLGEKVFRKYGNNFPLLFKFIDAKEDLSVQLHPSDEIAKERHNSFGKTEMWYIQQADEDARLILGFNKTEDKENYLKHISQGTLTNILHSEKVQKGDAFFIAPGTVHAIGAGVLLAEIQQTSDITYRIYDWDRPGLDGNMRALHTDLALNIISFEKSKAKLDYTIKKDEAALVCKSNYFETNILKLSKPISKDLSKIDSFIVYMCMEGTAIINSERISLGETLLLPACFNKAEIETTGVTLLEVYVP